MTEDNGRILDLYKEEVDDGFGDFDHFILWADGGREAEISAIEGVTVAVSAGGIRTRYFIYIDKRYDKDIVMGNIELMLLTTIPVSLSTQEKGQWLVNPQ